MHILIIDSHGIEYTRTTIQAKSLFIFINNNRNDLLIWLQIYGFFTLEKSMVLINNHVCLSGKLVSGSGD